MRNALPRVIYIDENRMVPRNWNVISRAWYTEKPCAFVVPTLCLEAFTYQFTKCINVFSLDVLDRSRWIIDDIHIYVCLQKGEVKKIEFACSLHFVKDIHIFSARREIVNESFIYSSNFKNWTANYLSIFI